MIELEKKALSLTFGNLKWPTDLVLKTLLGISFNYVYLLDVNYDTLGLKLSSYNETDNNLEDAISRLELGCEIDTGL